MEEIELLNLNTEDKLEALTKQPIDRVQLAKYAGASGDFNPLHLDDDFAKEIGMPGVIAHGMLVMGFLGEYVMKIAGQQAIVHRFKMRFGKMTFLSDEITCSAIVKHVDKTEQTISLELYATKDDKEVVGSGKAILKCK